MAKWNEDKFTDAPVATVLDDGPEPVEATVARIQKLIDEAKANDDTELVELYSRKLDALPRNSE